MIAKIIELSVKNKFLVILATLFVIAAGIYAIARTPWTPFQTCRTCR
jgi:Cu(I)/Ag(I) efflux system membrane protein CusA/SilA